MPHVNLRVKTHAELKQTGEAARPRHQLRGHSRLGTQTQTLERAAPTGGGGDGRPAPLGTRVGGAQARSLLLLTGGSHLHPRLSHQMSPSGDGNASPAPERVPGRSRRAATPAGGGEVHTDGGPRALLRGACARPPFPSPGAASDLARLLPWFLTFTRKQSSRV